VACTPRLGGSKMAAVLSFVVLCVLQSSLCGAATHAHHHPRLTVNKDIIARQVSGTQAVK
jgi:hypothetical protein